MKKVLTAITAFCLTFGLLESVNNDVEVQLIECEAINLTADMDSVRRIREGHRDDYNFTEDEVFDDGDSNGVVLNDREFYCQTWPTKCLTK